MGQMYRSKNICTKAPKICPLKTHFSSFSAPTQPIQLGRIYESTHVKELFISYILYVEVVIVGQTCTLTSGQSMRARAHSPVCTRAPPYARVYTVRRITKMAIAHN
jgi:hypothetical protein